MTLPEPTPDTDPLDLFRAWYAAHEKTGPQHPAAMILATAGADGQPSARAVLLKGVEGGTFRFFTHYESRKGRELRANPRVALVFFWPAIERQGRIEGDASLRQRAQALISIAHPDFRGALHRDVAALRHFVLPGT